MQRRTRTWAAAFVFCAVLSGCEARPQAVTCQKDSDCPAGAACSAGLCREVVAETAPPCAKEPCALVCSRRETSCGDRCVSLADDRAHCGRCDNACRDGEICSSGRCVVTCPSSVAFDFLGEWEGGRITVTDVGDATMDGASDLAFAEVRGTEAPFEHIAGLGRTGKDGRVTSLLNYSHGKLASPGSTFRVLLADVDVDGKPDLVSVSLRSAQIRLGAGTGAFQESPAYELTWADPHLDLAILDATGDGRPDVLVRFVASFGLFVGTTTGFKPFAKIGDTLGSVLTTADLNADGFDDLVEGDQSEHLSIRLGAAHGGLEVARKHPLHSAPITAVAADFNHDGIVDLAVSTMASSIELFLGAGGGAFAPPISHPGGRDFKLRAADFDNDGFPDLFALSGFELRIYSNSRGGAFSRPRVIPQAEPWFHLFTGDLDFDGQTDVVLSRLGAYAIYRGVCK